MSDIFLDCAAVVDAQPRKMKAGPLDMSLGFSGSQIWKLFASLGLGPLLMQAVTDYIAGGGVLTKEWVMSELGKLLDTIIANPPNKWEGLAAKILKPILGEPQVANLIWSEIQKIIPATT